MQTFRLCEKKRNQRQTLYTPERKKEEKKEMSEYEEAISF